MQYCPQSRSEPLLLAYIRGHANEARYATQLCSLRQDQSGVTAVLADIDSGERETVHADHLVAADGVHGEIRKLLGMSASGYGKLPIFVVFIYFRGPWREFVPTLGDGDAIQVKNDVVDGIFVPVTGDMGLFITTYLPDVGETAAQFTPQHCRELIVNAVGEPIDVQITDVAPWQPYEQVADQFRCGRVFFVGDAAHAMPPFKAGGANVAIQSAHNLAWKLAAVLHKAAGPSLLDTYHAERHPIGRFSRTAIPDRAPAGAAALGRQGAGNCRPTSGRPCSTCSSGIDTAQPRSSPTIRRPAIRHPRATRLGRSRRAVRFHSGRMRF